MKRRRVSCCVCARAAQAGVGLHHSALDPCSQVCEHPGVPYSIEYFHPKVLAEIESWAADVLADYARIAELLVEHGPNLRLPHSRAFGDGLFELRPKGKSVIGRAFYCFLVGQRVMVLHAFVKKSQQTPAPELKLARKRMKEVLHGRTQVPARSARPRRFS